MALTATAHPVPAASWDEQIVPALRKRLEAESRMLTKRMSMISAHSGDEGPTPTSATRGGIPEFGRSPVEPNERWRPPETPLEKARASPVATRPSAIPRPSLQYSRRGEPDELPPMPPTPSKPRPKRARTQSTPGLHNLPTPVSSRSNSPAVAMNPKPSRIPTATSTAKLGPASPSVPAVPRIPNGTRQASSKGYPPSPDTSPDLFPLPAAGQRSKTMPAPANSSRSSFDDQRGLHPKQSTEIIHEPPPFATAYEAGRLSFSNDEGERPFEHWYRGESRRNGGVGEVKVSTKEEMLNIATFGHRIGVSPASSSSLQGRRRAGTVSHRGSWYMDEDAMRSASGVLDEQPLTDLETSNLSEFSASNPNSRAATPRYPAMDLSGQAHDAMQFDLELDRRPSNMSLAPSHASRSASRQQQYEQLGVGGPRNQPSDTSLRVNTVVANNNGPSGASRRSPMSPAQQVAANAQRIRGASAQQQQARRGPAKQKPRSKSQPGLNNSTTAEESVEYEMDAIPVWTQPKANGNWDDVVLPAVAKKMGLVENYEQTDGTPRPRKRESAERIPPAPGTFGFDDSKYRPATRLHLDEFGRPGAAHDTHHTSGESEEERRQTEPILRPISPGAMRRGRNTAEPPPSPAPFSSYQSQPRPLQPPRMASQNSMQPTPPQPMVQAAIHPPPPPPERFVLEKKQEEESGCCCVVM